MSRATCNTALDFEAAMTRITSVLGVYTQTEMADAFGIRQSSISATVRRKSIPDSWLLRLVREYSVNPLWIMRGTGAQYLVPDEAPPATAQILRDIEDHLGHAPVAALLRTLATRMGRPDIQITEAGAA
ncbi:MAG: hypothetical protein DELT_00525 [Desulfovibrio sp.]